MLGSDAGLVHVGAVRPGGVARVRQGQRHGAQPGEGEEELQGDQSGSSQSSVDIKTKVVFKYMLLILKRNFCFDVSRRFGST